jgi:penicillin-insensitive murein endopeptidase
MTALRAHLARVAVLMAAVCAATSSSGCSIPSSVGPAVSGSIGLPHSGFLTDARELAREGKGYRWKSSADHHWGLPRMVALIEDAASTVASARPGSAPLTVGDISARGGGALFPKHRSHRTGRDVDLLFFVTTLDGVALPNQSFVKVGPDGLGVGEGGRFVRFDIDREWLLVRGLVDSKKAHVQWIFISRVLEALLIEHAIALGEPLSLIARTEQIMQQPGDSLPHDDHIHVRIACAPEEYATGCDGGPRWPWIPETRRVEAPIAELIEALVGPSVVPAVRDLPVASK